MNDPARNRKIYLLLTVVFSISGLVWIISGFLSPRFIFYPLIGLLNLGAAYACRQQTL